MKVDPQIKILLNQIDKKTLEYINTPDIERRYIRRLVKFFKNSFTEDEQVYIVKQIIEELRYKNIITDPDNLLVISNIKNRSIFLVFILTVFAMLIGAILFDTNKYLKALLDNIISVFRFII